MAAIRSKNTSPEKMVLNILRNSGIKYTRHSKSIPGTPDFVLKNAKVAIFVHGCFWHAHGCKISRLPEVRHDFWLKKLFRNIKRDARSYSALRRKGWRVIVVWECALVGKRKFAEDELQRVIKACIQKDFVFKQISGNRPDLNFRKTIKQEVDNSNAEI